MSLAATGLLLSLAALAASADTIEVHAPPKKRSPIETSVLIGRLSDRDPASRRGAFKAVASEYERRSFPNDVLPPLRVGLTDTDAEVRRDAAFALAALASKVYISSANKTGIAFDRKVIIDFSSDPPLRPALIEGLSSPDPKVRKYVPLVLGLAFPKAPDIEAALAARYGVEATTAARRNVVAAVSRADYSSPATVAMYKAAAADPDHVVRTRARRALNRISPKPSKP